MPQASPLHVLVETAGKAEPLDAPAGPAGKAMRGAVPAGPVKDALAGRWLGHPIHPLLTDVVIGSWTSAMLLDLLGGGDHDPAVRKLIGVGIAAYPVTAATGAHDWADSEAADPRVRRIGLVHATANSLALACQAASLRARRRGARRRGVVLSLAGGAALAAGGYLGAHLSYVNGVGVDQTSFDAGPQDWTPVDAAAPAAEGGMTRALADDTPVLLARAGGRVLAIHDRCSHRGCSLSAGTLDGEVVECGCHGSRFRLGDGAVERGPATAPQPSFEVRETAGRVEVRRRDG